jgi:hypothetical protein
MKVTVKATSWNLDDFNNKIILKINTDTLFTREDKQQLINRIQRIVEREIEIYEENKIYELQVR